MKKVRVSDSTNASRYTGFKPVLNLYYNSDEQSSPEAVKKLSPADS
ncbi:hypothetical protein [Desulfurococcus sp.]